MHRLPLPHLRHRRLILASISIAVACKRRWRRRVFVLIPWLTLVGAGMLLVHGRHLRWAPVLSLLFL